MDEGASKFADSGFMILVIFIHGAYQMVGEKDCLLIG